MTHIYKVGGHTVALTFQTGDTSLVPSFAPFAVDTPKGEAELRVDIDDTFRPQRYGQEVGQFDCGGTLFGVYRSTDGTYQLEVSDPRGRLCAVMEAVADFSSVRVALLTDIPSQRTYGLNNCLMPAYAFRFAEEGTLLLHASVIRKDGTAYAMTAPSGTGKSTHTYLWYKNIEGCDLMNDDNPILRVEDGRAILYGSPWSGKTPCYRNIQAPLGALVHIKQHPTNEIRPLATLEAYAALLPAVSQMKWDKRMTNGITDTLAAVLATTPVYELQCRPDAQAALLCYARVRTR